MEPSQVKESKQKREQMAKETWIRNVMRVYPEKTLEEVSAAHDRIYNSIKKA
jgi:hypothetical protein